MNFVITRKLLEHFSPNPCQLYIPEIVNSHKLCFVCNTEFVTHTLIVIWCNPMVVIGPSFKGSVKGAAFLEYPSMNLSGHLFSVRNNFRPSWNTTENVGINSEKLTDHKPTYIYSRSGNDKVKLPSLVLPLYYRNFNAEDCDKNSNIPFSFYSH